MKIKPVIQQLRFGGDVAENDDLLDRYFVQTGSFLDLVADEADLILGPKGSGKSAIFRMLSNPDVSISALDDVDLIPAFNPQGAVIFQRLVNDAPDATEALLRATWWAYIAGLIGNHIVDTYADATDIRELEEVLVKVGLREKEDRPVSVFRRLLSGFGRVGNVDSVETTLSFTPDGIPILGGKVRFGDKVDAITDQPVELESIIQVERQIMRDIDRRVWVAFDRLDEAFQDNRELERRALRSLIRTYLDLGGDRRIRLKLFLRTDVLDRISEGGDFVNITHVRDHRIRWDEETLFDLVTKRVIENKTFQEAFGIGPADVTGPDDRQLVASVVFPDQIDVGSNNPAAFRWIVRRVTDGTGELNPRNVITLMRYARDRQMAICDRDDPDIEDQGGVLLARSAVRDAWRDVSTTRLQDTLLAEFSHLRPWISRFEGQKATHNRVTLAVVLGLDPESSEFKTTVGELVYSGFLESSGDQYNVPFLYRPGAGVVQGSAISP